MLTLFSLSDRIVFDLDLVFIYSIEVMYSMTPNYGMVLVVLLLLTSVIYDYSADETINNVIYVCFYSLVDGLPKKWC